MDFDSDESQSDKSRSSITSDQLDSSNSEDDDSFIEELDEISLDEWVWDVDNSKFSSSFNYFDRRALGNNVVRPIDAFSKYTSNARSCNSLNPRLYLVQLSSLSYSLLFS